MSMYLHLYLSYFSLPAAVPQSLSNLTHPFHCCWGSLPMAHAWSCDRGVPVLINGDQNSGV